MKNYYKINSKECFDSVAKNILIFTKKNIYFEEIKCIFYFFKSFEIEKKIFQINYEKKIQFENLDFENLKKLNDYLEELKIYINNGKDDSPSIKLMRLFYGKEAQINFINVGDI